MDTRLILVLICACIALLGAGAGMVYSLVVQRRAVGTQSKAMSRVDESLELQRDVVKAQQELLDVLARIEQSQGASNELLKAILESLRDNQSRGA